MKKYDLLIQNGMVIDDPHHYPEGIDAVIVNGQLVIDRGEHTGNLPGQILRKLQKQG